MARLTISVNASGEPNDQDLVTVDVPLSLTVAEFKQLIESETSFPVATQHLFYEGNALQNDAETLEAIKLKDGDMLALMVNRGAPQPQRQRVRNQGPAPDISDENRIESIRQQIRASPEQMAGLIGQAPDLATVIEDPEQFKQAWLKRIDSTEVARKDRDAQIRKLNENPFDAEAQKKIEEIIRREKIEENLQYAYENNPAVFVQVTMLYVHVLVNGHPVKAFVDSGAQSTIMSPSCAEACGIAHLIDDRYSGMARGVGTARIIGKVHQSKIQIGDAELDCAFTVMEGKDVDLLFGLDMLKRHQACIDLVNNKLRFPHTEVAFLSESDIPRREEERMLDEPTIQGPDGTEIGAKTGTVRPQGTAKAAHESLQKAKQAVSPPAGPSSSSQPAAASSSGATSSTPAASRYSEADISQLVALGFSREEAINAMDATGGNVEYAAGLLFR